MTLQNLLAIQRLIAFDARRNDIARLIGAAKRNLADANIEIISNENRFDAAYKCIMQCAMVGLWAHGFRTPTNQPGHHQTAIQSLPLTIGVESKVMIELDALRKQRNIADYSGDTISPVVVKESLSRAADLLARLQSWLEVNRPDMCN